MEILMKAQMSISFCRMKLTIYSLFLIFSFLASCKKKGKEQTQEKTDQSSALAEQALRKEGDSIDLNKGLALAVTSAEDPLVNLTFVEITDPNTAGRANEDISMYYKLQVCDPENACRIYVNEEGVFSLTGTQSNTYNINVQKCLTMSVGSSRCGDFTAPQSQKIKSSDSFLDQFSRVGLDIDNSVYNLSVEAQKIYVAKQDHFQSCKDKHKSNANPDELEAVDHEIQRLNAIANVDPGFLSMNAPMIVADELDLELEEPEQVGLRAFGDGEGPQEYEVRVRTVEKKGFDKKSFWTFPLRSFRS